MVYSGDWIERQMLMKETGGERKGHGRQLLQTGFAIKVVVDSLS